MTKYNLGCGTNKIEGYVNIDKYEVFNPDKIIDLEKFPWDIKDNSATDICNVDFDLTKVHYRVSKEVCDYLVLKNLIPKNFTEEIENNFLSKIFMNTIEEIYIQLTVKKYT